MNSVLLFLLIVIELFLKPVRRAIVVFVIVNKGARVAGLLALFEIKQIGRSFINNSAILFVVIHVDRAIIAAHWRWIYRVDIANGVRKVLTLYLIAFGKLFDHSYGWHWHVVLVIA